MISNRRIQYEPTNDEYNIFDHVTTVGDAVRIYRLKRRSVIMWCDTGRIAAMLIGGVWVISVESLERYLNARDNFHRRDKVS